MGDTQLHGSIFLSHTGKDSTGRTLTPLLYDKLQQQYPNRRVFIDETGIKVGENLTDAIKSAIQHCDVFVAIVTEQYLHSKWPLLELHWAREHGRPVFAALVEVSVDEVKRWVRSDQALEVWMHEKLIQGHSWSRGPSRFPFSLSTFVSVFAGRTSMERGALEQPGLSVLSAEALRADVLGLFGAKVLEVTLEKNKFCWINAASLIATHLLEQYPDAGWPVDRPLGGASSRGARTLGTWASPTPGTPSWGQATPRDPDPTVPPVAASSQMSAGSTAARGSLLQQGGKALLEDLEGRATKVDVLKTEFRAFGRALRNGPLLQVVQRLCVLVEHDGGQPQEAHAALLDELSAVLDDAEVLITKATAPVAPTPSNEQALALETLKLELDEVLRRLGEFSSWDRADRLGRAMADLAQPTGNALGGAAAVVAAMGHAATAGDAPREAGNLPVRTALDRGNTDVVRWAFGNRRWRPQIPERLRFQVFQHLDDLVPELADLLEFTASIGIVGMGGIGKTTLARAALAMVEHHFDKVVFVAVGQEFDPRAVVASMWEQLFDEAPRPMHHQALFRLLVVKLQGMRVRVLLVLDDVWTAVVLNDLNFVHLLPAGSDNRVIVTTRVRGMFVPVNQWHIVQPPPLRQEHAQELLCWHAFGTQKQPAPEFEDVVRGMVKECKGLPLMLEVTGASLKGTNDVAGWRARLQRLQAAEGVDDDIHKQVREQIRTSTDVLPPLTKHCFVLLSLWPEDAALHRRDLAARFHWVCPFQTRTTSEWAQEQIDALLAKCLITDKSTDGKSFTMHDLVRDVAVQESKRGSHLLVSTAPETGAHVCTTARVLHLQGPHARELRLEAPCARWLEVTAPTCEKVTGTGACRSLRLLRLQTCPIRKFSAAGAGMLLMRVLEVLYCGQLQCLPATIGSMVHLERISLDGCASVQSLPDSIGCLRSLQHLSLRGCKALTGLPHSVGRLQQLTALLLAECYSLAELPDWVAGLSKLQKLDLSACHSVAELPSRLHLLTGLRSLDVRFCAAPVVDQARRIMPALGQHETMRELLKWSCEQEVFVRVLVHLQTVPAARVIFSGGRGEGKSQLCDHLVDYFHKMREEFGAPVFPDGFLLLRLQPARGGATNGKVSNAWLQEQLCAIHRAIFTRINSYSHNGPLWRYIASQQDNAGVGQSGNARKAVTAVKQCIRALLAGQRLLLVIDDAGPLLPHLFCTDGAIPPSFPGACLATVPHPLPSARPPAAVAVLSMCTGHAACERILAAEAYPQHFLGQTQLTEAHKAVGAQVVARLAHNPHAVALLGRLLSHAWLNKPRPLLRWKAALEALDAAGGGKAAEPLQLAYALAVSCLTSRRGAATAHFLGALQRLPADTILPAAAVAAVCRAGADDVALEALPVFMNDLKRLLDGHCGLQHEQHSDLLPADCLRVHQCLMHAIAAAPIAASQGDQLTGADLRGECASKPSDVLVAACVVGLLGTCSHTTMPTEHLALLPPEEGEWQLNWRAAFGDLGIHPAWLVQLLDEDATLSAGKQLLLSAATGRVWPQLVAEATEVLSHSLRAALGVLPLLLCRNAAGQVLWEAEHTDALLVAIRDDRSKDKDAVVMKLCSALAALEVCAPAAAAVSIIKAYMQLQHTRSLNITKGLPQCQLLCLLRGGQFAQVLLQASRAAEDPVMAHTMGAAALGLRRHANAVTHLQQAHGAFQREYGPQHAGTTESGAALARAQLRLGNYDAALQGFRQVEDAISCSLGPRQPAAFMAQADVALALKGMGKLRDALRLEDAAQRGLQWQLGSQDPRTVEVMLRCSDTQRRLGRVRAASRRCEQALSLTLPPVFDEAFSCARVRQMPELLQCIRLGCSGLAADGRVHEELEVRQHVLHAHNSVLGRGHRDTLQMLRAIGCSLARLGRHAEAVGMAFVALKACRERYGYGDPDALQSMQLMTEGLLEMGELQEAAAVVAAAQPLVAAEFGHGSPEAAWWQEQQQRTAEVPHHTTRQWLPARCLIQVLTHEAVVYDKDADALVLQEGHAATRLDRLPEGVDLLGSPAPTHVDAVVGARITRAATCDVDLVVRQLTALQYLHLKGMHLGADGTQQLAEPLGKLSVLTGLRCNTNGLGPIGADVICKVLPSLQRLGELSITHNHLGPRGTGSLARVLPAMTRITALDVGWNRLGEKGAAALARALPRMRQLLLLGLKCNDIGDGGMAVLTPSVKVLTKLQDLNLARNRIKGEGAVHLGRALANLTSLTALNLAYNDLGAAGVPSLKALTKLQDLNLKGNSIEGDGAAHLGRALANLTSLTVLNLYGNALDAAGMQSLKGLVNLQEIDVSNNDHLDDAAAAGSRTLSALTALTSLSAWFADAAVVRSLTPGQKATAQLRKLDLNAHRMGPEGASALAAALPTLTTLTYLDVKADRAMGVEGVMRVAPLLKKLRLLAHLNLARNAMGAAGVRALADAMPSLTALTYLDLSGNITRSDGAAVLGPALTHLSSLAELAHLNLAYNAMGTEGVRALAAAMPFLTALTLLSLNGNDIGSDGAAVLGPALTHLSRVAELQLGDNTLDEAEFEPVSRALATLPALVRVAVSSECADSTRRLVPASVQVKMVVC